MTTARHHQIFPELTPYYHCISRCVRRAWLCGQDNESGRNFDHRKAWIEARILHLGRIFAINVAAYAVMSNHYHVVLQLSRQRAQRWSAREVIARWGQVCRLPPYAKAYLKGESVDDAHREKLRLQVEKWRSRLQSVSWFMRFINEPLARAANAEDECKGRFWEGRFKSQALLDTAALVACMIYVDLNPVRAGITNNPECAPYTSFRRRTRKVAHDLVPFATESGAPHERGTIPMDRADYRRLLHHTAQTTNAASAATAPESVVSVLGRFGGAGNILLAATHRPSTGVFFGSVSTLRKFSKAVGKRWVWGCGSMRISAPAVS